MMAITTNPSVHTALRVLATTGRALDTVQNRVATGLKVTGALDDASNFAIAQGVRGELKAWNAVQQGLRTGLGVVRVALAGATAISDALGELRKRVVEYAAASTSQKEVIGADIQKLIEQIGGFARNSTFSGVNLIESNEESSGSQSTEIAAATFNGPGSASYTLGATPGTVNLDFEAVGTGGGQLRLIYDGSTVAVAVNPQNTTGSLSFAYPATGPTGVTVQKTGSPNVDLTFTLTFTPSASAETTEYQVLRDIRGETIDVRSRSLRPDDIGLAGFDPSNLAQALAALDAAELEVGEALGYYGAKQREFSLQLEFNERIADATDEGLGNIVDADLGREAAELLALQVQEALAIELLAIAATRPRALLALFAQGEGEPSDSGLARGTIIDTFDGATSSSFSQTPKSRGILLDIAA